MNRIPKTSLNLNIFSGCSYPIKCSFFFAFVVVSFLVIILPEFLWTYYQPRIADFAISGKHHKIMEAKRQKRPPNHNPEDPELVRELNAKLIPPAFKGHGSPHDLPFPSPLIDELRPLTDYKWGGYFFEVGAGDKTFFSDTLFMERRLGWTGLLVEPDPLKVKLFRRNAWIAPACVSVNNSAYEYHHQPYVSLHRHSTRDFEDIPHKVMCYPFRTFWLALNKPVIDFFSVDVGGDELEILETVPFSKVDIKIIHVDYTKATNGFFGIVNLMQRNGFKVLTQMMPNFLFFIKKEYGQHYKEI